MGKVQLRSTATVLIGCGVGNGRKCFGVDFEPSTTEPKRTVPELIRKKSLPHLGMTCLSLPYPTKIDLRKVHTMPDHTAP